MRDPLTIVIFEGAAHAQQALRELAADGRRLGLDPGSIVVLERGLEARRVRQVAHLGFRRQPRTGLFALFGLVRGGLAAVAALGGLITVAPHFARRALAQRGRFDLIVGSSALLGGLAAAVADHRRRLPAGALRRVAGQLEPDQSAVVLCADAALDYLVVAGLRDLGGQLRRDREAS